MSWRSTQSPETWGTLTDEEWEWAQQFGQSLSWDEYQSERRFSHALQRERRKTFEMHRMVDLIKDVVVDK